MADIATVAKAQAMALIMKQLFGVAPTVESGTKLVRVYYQPDKLKTVQAKIQTMSKTVKPGDVRVEWLPMVTPVAIKKVLPYAVGVLAVGYLIGKAT